VTPHTHESCKEKSNFNFLFERKVWELFLDGLIILMKRLPYTMIAAPSTKCD